MPPAPATPGAWPRAVVGLDMALALRQLRGDGAALVRALRAFVSVYGAAPVLGQGPGSETAAAGDDEPVHERWRRAAHSLRGAASAIGATALCDRLQAFEARLRAGEAAAALGSEAAAIDRLVADLARAIDDALAVPPDSDAGPGG